jgi:hypothetical protein
MRSTVRYLFGLSVWSLLLAFTPEPGIAATIAVESPTVSCNAPDVAVGFTADQTAAFVQLSFDVTYDATRLTFRRADLSASLQGWTLTPTASAGSVHIVMRPPARLSLVGLFATLTFQSLDHSSSDRIAVRVSAVSVLLSTGITVNGDSADGMVLRDCRGPQPPSEHPTGLQFRQLAGADDGPANVDGRGAAARFGRIAGIATTVDGTLYIADRGNYTIRRVTPEGVVSTIAGTPGRLGTSDGRGTSASFVSPDDIAVGHDGTLYVLDGMYFFTGARVRRITPAGDVTTIFQQTCAPVATTVSDLCGLIMALSVDAQDNVYLLDQTRVLRVAPGGAVSVLAGGAERGFRDGLGNEAAFSAKGGSSITVGDDGNIYLYDNRNRAVRKITPDGFTTTVAAGDPFSEASNPSGIAVSADGSILVHHLGTLFHVTRSGVVTTTSMAPLFTEGRFALGRAGEMYVAEGDVNDELWRRSVDGSIQLVAGTSVWGSVADGHGDSARFNSHIMAYNPIDGLLYTSDRDPQIDRCVLRAVSLDGVARTVPTSQEVCADYLAVAPDGALIAATLPASLYRITPTGVVTAVAVGPDNCRFSALAVDGAGNAYVACDTYVAKVLPSGSFVLAADEISAEALTVLPNGDLVAASEFRLLRITPNGHVLPFAGTGLFALQPDGTLNPASFGFMAALAADKGGGVYVLDVGFGNWAVLKHVTATGDVATIAGGGLGRQGGDASIARFAYSRSIAALPNGVALSEGTDIRIGTPAIVRRRSARH